MGNWIVKDSSREVGTAWAKAPSDVYDILKAHGFSDFTISVDHSCCRLVGILKLFVKIVFRSLSLAPGDALVLQMPPATHLKMVVKILLPLCRFRRARVIVFVHDLLGARGSWSKEIGVNLQYEVFRAAAGIIVHTDSMKSFLVNQGIAESKIVVLGVFDYLTECRSNTMGCISDFKRLTIAGTLSRKAVGFVNALNTIRQVSWHLYGPGYGKSLMDNSVVYHGCVPAEKLPSQIGGGFGLVWYGDSLQTLRTEIETYLSLIMPHKLSLYLAAGIPVVVSRKMACADFVESNRVGLVVDSVYDAVNIISDMTREDYESMCVNVKKIQERVLSGYYTLQAIRSVV